MGCLTPPPAMARASGGFIEKDRATGIGAAIHYLNRRLSRESWSTDVQPISFIPRSISDRIRPSARSTPA
jgi:hypothetical protein